jgi:hypothetical protein
MLAETMEPQDVTENTSWRRVACSHILSGHDNLVMPCKHQTDVVC